MIGTKLANYEITSHLGTGGMGEVYQATDSKLGRSVAIKLLPEAFTHDHDRAARFEREARVLASLNHPNIAAIYGIEESGGRKFLVMELVGGETLAERIKRGAVHISEALGIAKEIAEGLEAAHEKGIIHRDLKPANIKVTPNGKVKVLDFGLARALDPVTSAGDPSESPTLGAPSLTRIGVILGTAAYMSPEQTKGLTVDKRSDVWAFGCVLFEMLTATRAFPGGGISETLAAVLKSDPDWTALPAETPTAARRLLRRCLEKDSRLRLADIADARLEIQEAIAHQETLPAATLGHRRARWVSAIPWAVAALSIAVTLLITQNRLLNTPAPNRPVTRAELNLPAGLELYTGIGPSAAISPDGTTIVFVGVAGGVRQLYVRRLDQFEAVPLIGTDEAYMPFFSQDGKTVGFITTDRTLKKVTLADGQVVPLAHGVDLLAGGAWGPDDQIMFGRAGALWQIPASGGDPKQLTKLDTGKGELFHRRPAVVAGGKAILFQSVSGSNCDATHVEALSLADGRRLPVVDGTYPLYTASGHLIFFHDGALFAAPFDAQQLKPTGHPILLGENVAVDQLGQPIIAISASGSMAYSPGGTGASRLVWVSRNGVEKPISDTLRNYYSPRLEPKIGRRIAVAVNANLTITETARSTSQPLAAGGCASSFPVWGPDGRYVVFRTPTGMRRIDVDSNGPSVAISGSTSEADYPSSIYGDTLAFLRQTEDKSGDVYVLSLRGESQPKAVVNTPAYEGGPQFSPDGKLLAYASNKSERKYQVYVREFPAGADVQVSTQGGTQPLWNPKGGELFYRDGNKMMAAKVSINPDIRIDSIKELFDQRYVFYTATLATYDVSNDGESFVMLKDDSGSGRLNLVLNWLDELKLRVPVH